MAITAPQSHGLGSGNSSMRLTHSYRAAKAIATTATTGLSSRLPSSLTNLLLLSLASALMAVISTPSAISAQASPLLAFPGAEGFGAFSVGGRGGRVIEVTNLNDSGPGSLRAAIEASGPRIVVFRVGGDIILKSRLRLVHPYITIAGQTAPGGGITLRNGRGNRSAALSIETDQVIVRYIRARPGPGGLSWDEAAQTYKEIAALRQQLESDGSLDADDRKQLDKLGAACCLDGIAVTYASNVIVDHSSVSWGADEVLEVWGSDDVTVQWSIISEGLSRSLHFKGSHGYGVLVGESSRVSLHHNVIAQHTSRNPRISGGRIDFVNNVIYNPSATPGVFSQDRGDLEVNYVGNYVKYGPSSNPTKCPIALLDRSDKFNILGVYSSDNFLDGDLSDNTACPDVNDVPEGPIRQSDRGWWVSTRFDAPLVTTTSAQKAFDQVLGDAGATIGIDGFGKTFWRRDAVDERIVNDIINGTGKMIDHPDDVGGWPTLSSGTAPADSDHDGMPDDWESLYGFNLDDPSDGPEDADGDGYTNVEEYLNTTSPIQHTPANVVLPGMDRAVQDLDGDKLAEDLNGNGRLDFADVIALFEHLDSAEIQDNSARFDFDGNGNVDMGDTLALFAMASRLRQ